jgi:hypothetical protein
MNASGMLFSSNNNEDDAGASMPMVNVVMKKLKLAAGSFAQYGTDMTFAFVFRAFFFHVACIAITLAFGATTRFIFFPFPASDFVFEIHYNLTSPITTAQLCQPSPFITLCILGPIHRSTAA